MKDVAGKVAVITGAASGIGRGMAEALVAAGMKVVLGDIEKAALDATASSLLKQSAHVHAVRMDVSKPEDVEMLASEALRVFGAVHVLCNNAGVSVKASPTWLASLDDWRWVVGVNLMGVVHGINTFLPIMIEQGEDAHIVNTSSMAGLCPGGGAPYTATKSAIVALSESIYLELKQSGLKPRVSVLCPGFVATNIMDCDRNRPEEFSNVGPQATGQFADIVQSWAIDQINSGMSPRTVGEQVLDAIITEKFYILTDPTWAKNVGTRAQRILDGKNPVLHPMPGMDKLVRLLEAHT